MQALKFYKKHLKKMFSNLSTEVSISRIIELPAEYPSLIKIDLLITTISKKWADNNDYAVSLRSNNGYKLDSWTLSN